MDLLLLLVSSLLGEFLTGTEALSDEIFLLDRKGDLPPAKDLGKLVNLTNVRNSIGDPVTETQKDEIKKDLESLIFSRHARWM
jgi:hypothetical protein